MHVQRLILIDDRASGRRITQVSDIVPLGEAVQGCIEAPGLGNLARIELMDGRSFRFDVTCAGVRIRGKLMPSGSLVNQPEGA